ncbi:MAG: hypothetical protein ACQEXX_01680 [Bacillota bacterium]
MKPENMIGKLVKITNKDSDYLGYWGFVRFYDGRWFHVNGGSISNEFGKVTPVFERDEFIVPRNIDMFVKAGVVTEDGRELK